MSTEPPVAPSVMSSMPVPVEYRAGVAVQLGALLAQARLVEEFALPDQLEPAAVFTP
jgi:hypothetical protein